MLKKIKERMRKKLKGNANKLAKREQIRHALVLLLIGLGSYGFYCYSKSGSQHKIKQEEAHFDGVFDSKFHQGSDEALIEQQQKQIDALKQLVEEKKNSQSNTPVVHEMDEHTKLLMDTMQTKLAHLEEENKKMNEQLHVAMISSQQASQGITVLPPSREEMEAKRKNRQRMEREMLSKAGLETVRFNGRKRKKIEERTSRNYVWAGTFVEGVLLTGILGDAGINGSKNMGTAMIRLTSSGIMPNNQRSHLEGCFALVSSYGDLSGSSVVLHLETLSCAGKNVNFEQKAYGSVFDLDAMQDLRGTSILKTKPLLTYSAAAGVLAGIGNGVANYGSAQSFNPSSGTFTTYSPLSMAQSAAGGGISNPANRIADYVMRIADIYHPLVVARAGRRVSVLFTKGFWIDKEHQVYESGKSIDEVRAQKERIITTTISRAQAINTEGVDAPVRTPSVIEPELMMQNNSRMEHNLPKPLIQTNTPLFSTVQNEEPPHD
ncbi:TPA: TrbI/VirB10 family protein [Legionella anisa]|nr:conjugal transfer protein TraB [Legionella pneumophila]